MIKDHDDRDWRHLYDAVYFIRHDMLMGNSLLQFSNHSISIGGVLRNR